MNIRPESGFSGDDSVKGGGGDPYSHKNGIEACMEDTSETQLRAAGHKDNNLNHEGARILENITVGVPRNFGDPRILPHVPEVDLSYGDAEADVIGPISF